MSIPVSSLSFKYQIYNLWQKSFKFIDQVYFIIIEVQKMEKAAKLRTSWKPYGINFFFKKALEWDDKIWKENCQFWLMKMPSMIQIEKLATFI